MSLGGYADIFLRNTLASGVVPQISAIMGPCAGGAVYSPAITDFNIMVEGTSYMFVTGPDVIKTVTHEEVTKEELGGAVTHNETSGVAHFAVRGRSRMPAADSRAALDICPATTWTSRRGVQTSDPADREDEALERLVPDIAESAVRHARPDPGDRGRWRVSRSASSLRAEHHRRLRAARRAVRSASSRTSRRILAGTLDIDASVKAARFVRFCDAFNIPLVTFEDVPGFLPGTRAGVRRHHPPRREAAVRVRRGDGAEGDRDHAQGVRRRLLRDVEQAHSHRLQLRLAERRDRRDGPGGGRQHSLQARDRAGEGSRTRHARRGSPSSARSSPTRTSPPRAASSTKSSGPDQTRAKLIAALASLENKRDKNPPKKHGNIPAVASVFSRTRNVHQLELPADMRARLARIAELIEAVGRLVAGGAGEANEPRSPASHASRVAGYARQLTRWSASLKRSARAFGSFSNPRPLGRAARATHEM